MKRIMLWLVLSLSASGWIAEEASADGPLATAEEAATSTDANGIRSLDPLLSDYVYPYPVSFLEVDIQKQQLKMAYMDVKPSNYNGKNVVLLHGKNFNGAYWKSTIDALAKQGYRVIIPDQIGFGKSSKPEAFQYSFHQLARNTKQMLDDLDVEEAAVLGHSMGGMLATRFALMYPKTAQQLILVNPIGLEDYSRFAPYMPIEWWYENELESDYDSIRKYQQANYYDGKWKSEYDEWVNILAGWTKHHAYEIVAWNAALTYDMIYTQPVVYEFSQVTCPTLLIIGTRDRTALGKPLVSEEVRKTMGRYDQLGEETREKIPNAKLVEIENVGHLPHIEAFDGFIAPLSNFLQP